MGSETVARGRRQRGKPRRATYPCRTCRKTLPRANFEILSHGRPRRNCRACQAQLDAEKAVRAEREARTRAARKAQPRWVPRLGEAVEVQCLPPLSGTVTELQPVKQRARVATHAGEDWFWWPELKPAKGANGGR